MNRGGALLDRGHRRSLPSSAILAGLMAFASLVLALPAQAQNPNQAQGFRAENTYQSDSIEHVNLFNGNLTLTIPIGQRYPLGPNLSYGLTLVYTGNVWYWEHECENQSDPNTCYYQSHPRTESGDSNAGLGWDLTLGKFQAKDDPANPSPEGLVYLGPDQAYHELDYGYLHPNGNLNANFHYSQDSTYLRYDDGTSRVELPDGTYQQFEILKKADGVTRYDDRSRLTEIGDPFGHTLTITYSNWDQTADHFLLWTLTDSYNRTHTITFTTQVGGTVAVLSNVTLDAFGSKTASYDFSYAQDYSLPRACNYPASCTTYHCNTANATVPLLTQISLPDGSSYSMPTSDYESDASATCDNSLANINGALKGMTLPTGGSFEWDWRIWKFPEESGNLGVLNSGAPGPPFNLAVGLAERRWMNSPNDVLGYWTYDPEISSDPNDADKKEEIVTVTNMPPGDSTKHYFSAYPGRSDGTSDPTGGWTKYEYGLPFTRLLSDNTSPGRYLSTEVYDKAGHLVRTTYVRYERDGDSKANPRLVSERTVYNDNGSRHADLDLSDFDGLGHYRTQVVSGTFGAGASSRTVYTDFNPNQSISTVPGTGEPWILGIWDMHQVTEGGQTVTEQADFDPDTGFLIRMRRWKDTSTAPSCGQEDVLIARQSSGGFVSQEDVYGGDGATLGCGALSEVTLPNHPQYQRRDTYSCGSLATDRWYTPSGSPLSFYSVDRQIDCSTGLTSTSEDTSGLATTYTYDKSGRLLTVAPPTGGATTSYTYSNKSGSLPARVTIQRKSDSTVLVDSQVRFDPFGRVAEERRTMPGDTTSVRTTAWNSRGWIDQRSEWYKDGTAAPQTLFRQYDPFGRPGSITLPDGQKITIDYSGVRSRSVTASVWAVDPVTLVPSLQDATTTEVYDLFGRLTRVTDANGTRTSYGYDAMDHLTSVDENDQGSPTQTRSFTYDGRGFLTSEDHPEIVGGVTYSGYDPLGNPGEVQRGGQDLSYSYDSAGRLTTITETGTTRVWKSWTYATDNSSGWSNGKLIEASRLNRVLYPGTASTIIEPTVTETYTYGGVGGRISEVLTRVENVGDPGTANTQPVFKYDLSYDALGEVTSRSYPECTYHYCVDTPGDHTVTQGFTDGLLTSVSQFATSITYHPDGLWATVVHSNDVTDHQDVDATGMPRPARLSTSGASENFDTGTYAYDGAGNIKAMGSFSYVYDLLSRVQDAQVEVPKPGCGEVNYVQNKKDTGDATYTSCGTVQAGPSYTVGATGDVTLQAGHAVVLADGFSVESGGRLTAGVDPNLDPAGLPTPAEQSYVYDAFGNLTSITTTFGGGSGQPSVMRTMPSDSGTNRLSGLTYDDSGNVTSWLTSAYAYDPFNMMTEADSTEGHFDFVYGPGDERLWVIDWTNGSSFSDWVETWTLRDINGSPLRQYRITGGNTEKLHWSADPEFPKDYAWRGGSLLGSVTAEGVVRHFHLDHLGSPRMVTDSSRHTLALHLYFPFGEEATDPSQDSLKLKFTGHERDDLRLGTTYDLDYMHARYYSPQIGRFFSFDQFGGNPAWPASWNRYAYALGGPLKFTDPRGKYPFEAVGQIGQDYLQCLLNGGCESIEVTADAPGYNPLTGVAGLQSLISGSSFLNGLDNLDIKRYPTPTIGPAPPEKPNAPARPDYVTFTLSGTLPPTPYTATIFGVTATLTLDKYGNLYFGIGGNAGKNLGVVGATLVAGGFNDSANFTEAQMRSFLSGITNNFTLGSGVAFGWSRPGLSGPKSAEFGLAFMPSTGVSTVYSWHLLNLGRQW